MNVSFLKKKLSVFPYWVCVFCVFFTYSFYNIEVVSLYSSYFMKVCWILSHAFSVSIEMIMCFSPFTVLMWPIMLPNFHMLICFCIWGINPTQSWCTILSICCWILFVSILLSIFESIFKRNFVQFSWGVFIWFWYQGYDNLIGWVRMCSLLFNFLEKSEKDWC